MSKSEICLNFRSVAWNRILGRTRISFSNTFEKHTVYNIVPLDQCGINQKPTQGSIWGLHRQSKIFHKYEIKKITSLIKMVEKLAFLWENGDDHDVIECRFASSQMRGWKGWGLRRRIKWRSRQNGFPRISNKFYCPFEPIWFAQISWILISFQKVPSGP